MTSLESAPTVSVIPTDRQERAIASLMLAFADDPAVRWMYPDPHQYRTFFPRFIRAFGGKAFSLGTAHQAGGWRGASLWLPPGASPDEMAVAVLLQETVDLHRQEALFSILGQMGAAHPTSPHWYLPLIGIDPRHQREGYGSALLAPVLASLDQDGSLAYLESTNSDNLPFYERHGFVVTGEIRAGDSPTIFPMIREPR